jgi:hypothetical protein
MRNLLKTLLNTTTAILKATAFAGAVVGHTIGGVFSRGGNDTYKDLYKRWYGKQETVAKQDKDEDDNDKVTNAMAQLETLEPDEVIEPKPQQHLPHRQTLTLKY